MSDTAVIILVAVLVVGFTAAVCIPVVLKVRRTMRPGKADVARAQQLMASGARARATVLSVQPTGMIVNNVNVGCVVTFRLEPIDGRPPFEGTKDAFFPHGQMPRMGDVWPAWYDRNDPTQFVVSAPGPPTPEQLATFRQFGISHPLEPGVGPT
jgi:hypothetical protein